jgi:hypothetical protein
LCFVSLQIRLIDLERQAVRPCSSHASSINSLVALSASVFASGGADGTVRCHDSRIMQGMGGSRANRSSQHSLLGRWCRTGRIVEQPHTDRGMAQLIVGLNQCMSAPSAACDWPCDLLCCVPHDHLCGTCDPRCSPGVCLLCWLTLSCSYPAHRVCGARGHTRGRQQHCAGPHQPAVHCNRGWGRPG